MLALEVVHVFVWIAGSYKSVGRQVPIIDLPTKVEVGEQLACLNLGPLLSFPPVDCMTTKD